MALARPAHLWPLALILMLAAALRLFMLGRFSFWFDEVYVANLVTYKRSLQGMWEYIVADDAHPPLYYTLMWAWAWVTGLHDSAFPVPPVNAEWVLRLPSALLGVWNVALVAALAGRVAGPVGGGRAALCAGALAACSGVLVAQDQQARMLTLLTTLALLGTLALDEVLRRPTKGRAVVVGLLWVAALYTQYLAALLIAAQVLWAALRPAEARRVPWLWVATPLLLFVPWVPVLLKQLGAGAAHPEARVPLPLALSRGAQMLIGGVWPPPVPRLYWGPYWVQTAPTAFTVLLGTLGTSVLLLAGHRVPGRAFLLALPLGFAALWLGVSAGLVNIFDTWYLGPLAALLCVAWGVGAVSGADALRGWLVARRATRGRVGASRWAWLLTAPLLAAFLLQAVTVREWPLGRWREVREVLQQQAQPGDVLGFSNQGSMFTSAYYLVGLPEQREPVTPARLLALVQGGARVWLIHEYTYSMPESIEEAFTARVALREAAQATTVLHDPRAALTLTLLQPK